MGGRPSATVPTIDCEKQWPLEARGKRVASLSLSLSLCLLSLYARSAPLLTFRLDKCIKPW